jgi:hypothetical protein
MTGTWKLKAAALILLLIALETSVRGQQVRLLECQSTFSKDATSADLIRRFGVRNVIPGEIYVGEGYSEHGTVLFADSPEDRVEIRWKDIERQRMPNIIYVRGTKSHWRTEGGLALGLDLITVEKLNGRPFKLLGLSVATIREQCFRGQVEDLNPLLQSHARSVRSYCRRKRVRKHSDFWRTR